MIDIRIHTSMSDMPLDKKAWDGLVQSAGNVSVFSQYFWVTNWWQFFGQGFELCLLTAEENGQIIAFAPLMIDDKQTLRFIGDTSADYLDFVITCHHGEVIRLFLQTLADIRGRWKVLHLRNIPRGDGNAKSILAQARDAGLYPWMNYAVAAPYLKLADNEDIVRSKVDKYSIRRSQRLLAELGDIRFVTFQRSDEAAEYWQAFAQQHVDRCRQVGRHSSFSNPDYLRFLQALFESDPEGSRVLFSAIFMGDKPIAFHFGFVSQGRLLWYKPSFDITVKPGSPGISLICHLIQYAKKQDLAELDFTIGEEAFKDRFSSDKRTVESFRIHRSFRTYAADAGYWWLRNKLRAVLSNKRK